MENINIGYVIIAILIAIPSIALMIISKEDIEKFKNNNSHKHS